MNMTPSSGFGPILGATLIAPRVQPLIPRYIDLGLEAASTAPNWGHLPDPIESRVTGSVYLGPPGSSPWLRLAEIPDAPHADRFGATGWFSLEVATCDVQRLANHIGSLAGFDILSAPAPLDVDGRIIAMQVTGPAGELYYFTEIGGSVPPFELPTGQRLVDQLFIAVQTTLDRAASVAFWEQLAGRRAALFDTRIGVLNRGLGLPEDSRLPVGVVQFAGQTLIEIDELPSGRVPDDDAPTGGIAMVSLQGEASGRVMRGPAGEWIECLGQSDDTPQPRE